MPPELENDAPPATEKRELSADLTATDALLYQALEGVVEEVGQFSQAAAHYMVENPFSDRGMVCSSCAFYRGPAACEVVAGEIEPGALCKHWIIPASLLAPAEDQAAEPEAAAAPSLAGSLMASTAPRAAMAEAATRTLTGAALRSRFNDRLVQSREIPAESGPTADGDLLRWTFSSEQPVERWFGQEVLSHAPGAADLSRLNDGGLHLWNHNRDVVLGRVMEATIGPDRRGYVATRWSPNTLERGSEEWKRRQDIESGTTTKSSFAYEIQEAVDMGDGAVLVTKWQPLETSTVSIPADNSVGHPGVGRSLRSLEEPAMPVQGQLAALATISKTTSPLAPAQIMTAATAPIDDAVRSAQDAETERILAIQSMCKNHGMPETLATDLVSSRRSVDQAREVVLEKIGMQRKALQDGGLHYENAANIGMDQKDLSRYNEMNILRHLADPTNRGLMEKCAFEFECSREAEKVEGVAARGVKIPFDYLAFRRQQRDQLAGNFALGGALVGTELQSASFIDTLRNESALLNAGITMITGLTTNVEIPTRASSSQHYWVGEVDTLAASDQTFGSISSTPKHLGVRVGVNRLSLLMANPGMDGLTRDDMNQQIALGLDASGFYGTGSGKQPLGLANVSGIGGTGIAMSGGATYDYPTSLGGGNHNTGSWSNFVKMRAGAYAANVSVANATYWMNGITMAGCEETLRASAAGSDYILNDAGRIGRYPVRMTNQVQSNDVFFGDPRDLVLLMWGGVDVVVDNLTRVAEGVIMYNMIQSIDWVCRRPQSFSKIS